MSWDNYTDAQLAAMSDLALQLRVEILTAVALSHKHTPDAADADRACQRAVDAWVSRGHEPTPLLLAGLR